jgi:sodium/potassium-transporting ATPase subunit alpha
MTIFAFCIGILVLFVGVAIGYPWKIAAMIATGVTIASAPGILNLEVTILLTLAVKRLSAKAIISKNLHVIEELGSTSCLCSDKTGTITINKMMVSHLHFNSKSFKAK